MIIGGPPPACPGDEPGTKDSKDWRSWETRAKRFVTYYALLFLPWDEKLDPRDTTRTDLAILPWKATSLRDFIILLEPWNHPPEGDNTDEKR